jgi:hypothetical protein
MKYSSNLELRKIFLEKTGAKKPNGKPEYSPRFRLIISELIMTYNPGSEGCHPSGETVARLLGFDEKEFRRATRDAKKLLGLRWIKLKRVDGKRTRSEYAYNSYDFRHIDSRAAPAWRGDGKVWSFDNRGNIDEKFNGGTLSLAPVPIKGIPAVPVSATLAEGEHAWDTWRTGRMSNGSYELASALVDHMKLLSLSKDEAFENAKRVTSSDLDYESQCALVNYATSRELRRIMPDKWNVRDSSKSDAEALREANR